MRLVLLGLPGAGKGTQGGPYCCKVWYSAHFHRTYHSSGSARRGDLGQRANEYITKGDLVPPMSWRSRLSASGSGSRIALKVDFGWISPPHGASSQSFRSVLGPGGPRCADGSRHSHYPRRSDRAHRQKADVQPVRRGISSNLLSS